MAELSSANDTRYLSSVTASAKRSLPNVSSGWVVMLLSGLVAMVIFLAATSQGGQKYSVSVISKHVEPGQPITAAVIREEKVNVGKEQLSRMVTFSDFKRFEGWIATGSLEPGDILLKSSILEAAAPKGLRAMSIAVDRAHAVGGDLKAGDKVDVIDASVTPATYVAQDIQVLSVKNDDGGLSGRSDDFSLTLAVDANTAALLSNTIKAGKFDIIAATGAAPR